MSYKFHLSVLTGAIMIAVLATLVAPAFTGAVGPTANPPDNAGLVPNFSGLNVTGDSTLTGNLSLGGSLSDPNSAVEINDSVSVSNDLNVTGTSTLSGTNDLRGEIKNNKTCGLLEFSCFTDIFINDKLRLGDNSGWNLTFEGVEFGASENNKLVINADVEIQGKLKATQMGKIYQNTASRSVVNNSYNNQSVTCNSGDWLLSCYGGFDPSVLGTLNAGITGIESYTSGSYQGCTVAVWNKTGATQTMYTWANCMAVDENWG
jgi:hypothetical protein